jgi:predicted secreted Zn-dependent protease
VGWPRKITWDEFQKPDKRPPGEKEDASIHSEGELDTNISPQLEKGRFRLPAITIRVEVMAQDTWVVKDKMSDDLLNHEQGHYDITGLLGKELGEGLLALRAASVTKLQAKVTRYMTHYRDQEEKIDKRYDAETDHGRKADQQDRWNKKLDDCMKNGTRLAPVPSL